MDRRLTRKAVGTRLNERSLLLLASAHFSFHSVFHPSQSSRLRERENEKERRAQRLNSEGEIALKSLCALHSGMGKLFRFSTRRRKMRFPTTSWSWLVFRNEGSEVFLRLKHLIKEKARATELPDGSAL